MTTVEPLSELTFEPPGPGPWNLDTVHFPRPVTHYWMEMRPEPFARGFREVTSYYGLLFGGIEFQYVNGFAYSTMRPLDEQEIPARLARAQEVIDGKLWRDQLRDWDETYKPRSIKDAPRAPGGRSRRAVRRRAGGLPEALPRAPRRDDLSAHALHRSGGDRDRRLPRPRGGLDRRAASRAAGHDARCGTGFRGSIGRARCDDRGDSEGRPSGRGAARLRRRSRECSTSCARSTAKRVAAVSGYLELIGYRLLDGFDIAGRYALELPDALLRAIRIAVGARRTALTSDVDAKIAEVRRRSPRSTVTSSTSCSARRG